MMRALDLATVILAMRRNNPVSRREKRRSRRERQFAGRENRRTRPSERFRRRKTGVHGPAAILPLLKIGLGPVNGNFAEGELDFDAIFAVFPPPKTANPAVTGLFSAGKIAAIALTGDLIMIIPPANTPLTPSARCFVRAASNASA